jgi:hypothetical protein
MSAKMFPIVSHLLSAVVLILPLVGCGGSTDGVKRSAVSGQVELDGAPLKEGTILFTSLTGNVQATALGTITNGSYSIPADRGPAPGDYRIEISALEQKETPTDPSAAMKAAEGPPPKQLIAEKYNSKSELKTTINAGSNTGVDFKVESAAKSK